MTGGHEIRAKPIGQGEKLAHFHGTIARDARTWRAPFDVRIDKRIDDVLSEQFATIKREVRNAQMIRSATRIVLIFGSTTTTFFGAIVGVIPKMQRDANDVISRVAKASSGDGRVDSSAHGHDDSLTFRHGAELSFFQVPAPFGICNV